MNFKLIKLGALSLLAFCFFFSGCKFQAKTEPRDVFENFIEAIYKKDEKSILSFIHPASRGVFSSELGKQIQWYDSLKRNTELSKPKFLKLDWIKRGSLVKVVYTHSGDYEDYLPMILQENKWWIDFGNHQKLPVVFHNIPRFVPGK